jgi:hypothetical protein
MSLIPNDFPFIKDYLYKFKTLRIFCIKFQLDMLEYRCIYVILDKIGSTYSIFVCTFYATRESLDTFYQKPILESFCDAFIREQDKLLKLRVISTVGTFDKVLVAQ